MRKFPRACGQFAKRPPCRCGGRTFWTDNNALLAVADGQDLPDCDPKFCGTMDQTDAAAASGRTVRLPKLRAATKRAIDSFQEEAARLAREKCAHVEPGNPYVCMIDRMREQLKGDRVPTLRIGSSLYQTRLLMNVLRCVGQGRARMAFVRREYGPPAFPRPSVDLLALGAPDGSWTAAVMPMMPDQPYDAEASPESLEGRRR
jgi:hypothetical protein